MEKIDMDDLTNFMNTFASQNNWEDKHVPEQLRSFFTTWAFLWGVEADTKPCDYVLHVLYRIIDAKNVTYDEFENYMLKFIV